MLATSKELHTCTVGFYGTKLIRLHLAFQGWTWNPTTFQSRDVSCGYLFRYRNSTDFNKKECCALQDAWKQLKNFLVYLFQYWWSSNYLFLCTSNFPQIFCHNSKFLPQLMFHMKSS